MKGRPLPAGGTIGAVAPEPLGRAFAGRARDPLVGVEGLPRQARGERLGSGRLRRGSSERASARHRGDVRRPRGRRRAGDRRRLRLLGSRAAPSTSTSSPPTSKPFVGYSDITVLHVAFRTHAGLATFYGPGLMGVGSSERGDSVEADRELRALTDPTPIGEVPANPDDSFVGAIGSGRASGTLAGGCLWLVRETLATPWEADLDGCILFFEDVHCPPWYVDGMLLQLRNAGRLDNVAGIAIGEFAKSEHWREQEPRLRSRSAGGRLRAPSRATWRATRLQPPARTRQAPLHDSAQRPGHRRRRRERSRSTSPRSRPDGGRLRLDRARRRLVRPRRREHGQARTRCARCDRGEHALGRLVSQRRVPTKAYLVAVADLIRDLRTIGPTSGCRYRPIADLALIRAWKDTLKKSQEKWI